MKKYITILLAVVMTVFSLSACGTTNPSSSSDDKIQIVTTIFPEYDWVKQILGDEADYAEITMLLDNGVDLHSYQPTAADILKISKCDLFIYVGGESDEWVEDALKEATNPNMRVINLLDALGDSVKEEEVVEGMQEEDEHEHHEDDEHKDEKDEHEHEEEEIEYDEHVWLSLKNAKVLCKEIANALAELDAGHADTYSKNLTDYTTKLDALDAEYQSAVDSASQKTILFGDRFPFRYLVDDYNLDYYAAFVGCSAETEASFKTITFLAGKMDELNLHAIFTLEKSDQKIAQTIIDNTTSKNQKIVTIDSMQSTTSQDIENGATYISVMESNLNALIEAIQ